MTQSVQKQIGVLPAIETELHFIQIGREMLCADLVPGSHDAPLQERECILNRIRMNVATNILPRSVIDGLMLRLSNRMLVGLQAVSDDYIHVCADIVTDVLRQCAGLSIFSMKESQFPIPLANTDYYFFVRSGHPPSGITLFSAHIGFIHLDSTVQHGQLYFFHSSTNTMAEIPRSLVTHSEGTLDLIRGHALASFHQKQDGHKPARQWQVRVVKDRARSHGKLIAALAASELLARIHPPNVSVTATRAFNASGPAEPSKNLTAIIVSREQPIQFRECHGRTSEEEKAQNKQAA